MEGVALAAGTAAAKAGEVMEGEVMEVARVVGMAAEAARVVAVSGPGPEAKVGATAAEDMAAEDMAAVGARGTGSVAVTVAVAVPAVVVTEAAAMEEAEAEAAAVEEARVAEAMEGAGTAAEDMAAVGARGRVVGSDMSPEAVVGGQKG